MGATLLTRAGNFRVDEDGNLLTATGDQVQGWTETGGVVNTNAPIGTILVPVGSLRAPSATTEFSFNLNLNASAVVGEPSASFSTTIDVVDSIGAAT
jgi:flagellar hook protein FlgE